MSTTAIEREQVIEQLRHQLNDVFSVESVTVLRQPPDAIAFRGALLVKPDPAYETIQSRFIALGYTPRLTRAHGQDVVTALPGLEQIKPSDPRINLILFFATIGTTILTGGLENNGFNLVNGLLFATTLLTILGAHEFGHYFVARYYRAPVTLPYFIPMPPFISFTGTMGAVIRLKAPFTNRKSLFDVGIAGPLAGLVFAVPLMFIGLALSEVRPLIQNGVQEGNSIFYAFAKLIVFGKFLPSGGEDVIISPVAWAAWWGLFITALNLLPAGQLDGGHVTFALLGRRARYLGWATMAVLALFSVPLGSFYPGFNGWLFWVALIFITGVNHPTPLNELSELGAKRIALGVLAWIIFILIFTPLPISLT
ncbi:MAG: site-2 protease family protein [Chloroflexota bacterium]